MARSLRRVPILLLFLLGIGYYKLTKLYSVSISPVIYQSEEDPDILRICHCDSPIIEAYPKNLPDSTCSKRAKARGLGQKVISFALFGEYFGDDGQPNWYSQGAWDNAELLPVYYGSDWIMRLYHNQVGFDEKEMRFLCDLKCNHSHVDLCYVGNIPHYEQIEEHPGTLWRFLPMGDPLVDVFHVRDLDSRPSDRETAALAEFHESQEQFHILRDHRNHRAAILAGMWGGKPSIDRIGMTTLLRKMLTASNKFRDHAQDKVFDQFILTEALFPAIKDVAMAHDSFHCGLFRVHSVRPFPTSRPMEPYNFIGAQMFGHAKPYRDVCPPPCRPKHHMDWLHC
ncbi:uncharacterized protein LOC131883868 [Tigriopus californicus]|uniref:uncharacterized protein LOC131883868 n=1 Tax=Tigriopus californicus TaxID=6832 RepID=UPI0027DA70A7|nr:uncharacterized protein LOC131883868 [Tigriopus californicus]